MSTTTGSFESSLRDRSLLEALKEHVVQLEALVVYVLIALTTLYILEAVVQGRYRFLDWLVPCLFLAGIRLVVRVTNPESDIRNRLLWSATLGGVLGTIGGALGLIVDIGSLGLSGGLGTLAGVAVGSSAGAALGSKIENRDKSELLQHGDAFDYLYRHHKKNPLVANAQLVQDALAKIPYYDKNEDGRRWYPIAELDQFLKKGPGSKGPV